MFFLHAAVIFLCSGLAIKSVRRREDWWAAFFITSTALNVALAA